MKQKVLIKVSMHDDKSRKKAMTIAVRTNGVKSASIKGDDQGQIEVTGEAIDIYKLASKLRKKVGYAELVSVGPVDSDKGKQPTTTSTTPKPQPWVGVKLPDYCVYEVINDGCNYQPGCTIM